MSYVKFDTVAATIGNPTAWPQHHH